VEKLLIARIRSILPIRGRQYLDGRQITDITGLREVLQSWEATEGSIVPEEKWNKPSKSFALNCFKCGHFGHKAIDCREGTPSSDNFQKGNSASSEKHAFTCFACGKPGHKSPDCPNRAVKREPEERKETEKKKSLTNNRISTTDLDDFNIVQATIGDSKLPLLLDSGAQISVIPEEVVPSIARTGESIKVKGFTGGSQLRETARVKIRIGDKVLDELVA